MKSKIGKLLAFFKSLFSDDHDKCYSEMEKKGYAIFGCCCGQSGGDSTTEYLNYDCIDCPYFK